MSTFLLVWSVSSISFVVGWTVGVHRLHRMAVDASVDEVYHDVCMEIAGRMANAMTRDVERRKTMTRQLFSVLVGEADFRIDGDGEA